MNRFLLALMICFNSICFGGYSHINGEWVREEYIPTLSVQEHYDLAMQLLYKNEWKEALRNFLIVTTHFKDSPFYADSVFYSAICYYFRADFERANKQFDQYLGIGTKLKHFEKTFAFKFQIAEYYRNGWKKHLFGVAKLPILLSADEEAIKLYDEVIAAMGGHELAAKSLFGKGQFLRSRRKYKESVDTLKILTHRFPKHSLAADGYLEISEIYIEQIKIESQNPDYVALAQLNLGRFSKAFPSDERVTVAENNIAEMQEIYAKSLFDTGRFYERKKKPGASVLYYKDASERYPQTESAQKSEKRLTELDPEWKPNRLKSIV